MFGFNSTMSFLMSLGLVSDTPKIIGQTEFGRIEGTSSTGRDDRTIYEFRGIPYAVPPLGDLRFKAPVPWNTSWDDVRDGTSYGNRCKQFHLIAKFIIGHEDCLFLNVYTHSYRQENYSEPLEEAGDSSRPVIVYFHGGLFMHGSGEFYKPKYLLDADVVLVTVNYRLGILGFLNLGTESISGNAGLKDQVLALKWVQRNIQNFGGDPQRVTIMGESAGAACVHYHILSPMSRGLFQRAISQSGNAFVSWASQDRPQEQALQFAAEMNCMKSSMAKIAKCLRSLDSDKIARSQRAASDILHHRFARYAPTIEAPGEHAFISDFPEKIAKSGNITRVPWLVGANSEEGLIYSAPILRNETIRVEFNKNWTAWTPILFRFADEPNKTEIADEIRTFYLGNSSTEINMDVLHNLTTFLSDRSFFEGLHNSIELHKGQFPIYPYIYGYEGRFSFAKLLFGMTFSLPAAADVVVSRSWKWFLTNVLRVPETSYGVAHGDELPLLFNLPWQKEPEKEKTFGDYDMSKILVNSWTSFAKDGVPAPVQNITWPVLNVSSTDSVSPCETDNGDKGATAEISPPIQFIKLNRTTEIIDEPFHPRIGFWRKLNLRPLQTTESLNEQNSKENCV